MPQAKMCIHCWSFDDSNVRRLNTPSNTRRDLSGFSNEFIAQIIKDRLRVDKIKKEEPLTRIHIKPSSEESLINFIQKPIYSVECSYEKFIGRKTKSYNLNLAP